ncbi:nucleolin-like [Lytechinus variegatus]|uniref:nucleolin-like n=1 Tax=Lytechinus variegatus TaxID=7654 RepID=UPI001BB17AC6|nr:nucleolin-like [Lytechinus variegatus]XP_041479971.1 nucleolin-like [Lytechinus variegatus]
MDGSPEQKKIKKTKKLSKTIGAQKLSKEAILNRMSSGKKRPKSETKIKKDRMKTPSKEDLVAKKLLLFQDGSDDDNDVDRDTRQSPVKTKTRTKNGGDVAVKKGSSSKKLQSSTSKWKVSEGTPSIAKQKPVKNVDAKETKSGKKKKATDKKVEEEEDDDEDVEIDFPVLKRKSLGLGEFKATLANQKSPEKETQVSKEVSENGQSKKKKKKNAPDETSKEEPSKESADQITGEDKGKKRRKKKRGKKRKRSNSESDEPQAKKGKPAREGFAVRCGNLPVGVMKGALRMFIGESDIFPSEIIFKRKRKGVPGEKKQSLKYATVICNTLEEAERLCRLNGISMPSPVGNKERKLLIHMMNESSDAYFKKKVFVANLHPKVTEEELLAFFETSDCNPTNVILRKKGSDTKSRGYGFVWLTSAGDADKALKLRKPTLRDQVMSIARSHRHPGMQEP